MNPTLHRFDEPVTHPVSLDYWLDLPRDYGRDDRPWPLVLYLHGKGERGDVEKARKHGPPKRIAAGADFPFVLLTPSCPSGGWWRPEELEPLVQKVSSAHRVDVDRIYGTGLSMGGFGVWAMAITYPHLFAAIAPICGGGSPYLVERIMHLPTWTFHGARDPIVPLYESQRMVDALRAQGGDARLTIYADCEHDAWTRAYDDAELYAWMLGQRRPAT